MRSYRRAAHAVYECHYHFVFITKYRKPVLKGEIALAMRDVDRGRCAMRYDIEILAGHVRPDHVHLLLSVPPHLAPSRVMQAIKGKTSSPAAAWTGGGCGRSSGAGTCGRAGTSSVRVET